MGHRRDYSARKTKVMTAISLEARARNRETTRAWYHREKLNHAWLQIRISKELKERIQRNAALRDEKMMDTIRVLLDWGLEQWEKSRRS